METYLTEWLGLLFRWIHVIAAIAWIGHAFLFHTLEHTLRRPEVVVGPNVEGEMWMAHGGGFFRLQKTRGLPAKYTGDLLWFKWEAAFTWLSGFCLLVVVFYMGGGVYLIDRDVADISANTAILVSLGTLAGGWLVYDLLWASPLGNKRPALAGLLSVGVIALAAFGLCQVLSGRAAFLHVGALMGTIMVGNVWLRILPGMRRMIRAMDRGDEPDFSLGAIGKQRSLHNGYMHFPIIFLMISNHFPTAYAHEHNWLVLILFVLFGACMREVLYNGLLASHIAVKGVLALSVGALVYLTVPRHLQDSGPMQPIEEPAEGSRPVDAATAGVIRGVVSFAGTPPEPARLDLRGGCESMGQGPVYDESIQVENGRLANVFVWLRDGWQGWDPGPVPTTAVDMDQRGCIYHPRVTGVRVGQPVVFINSDALFHNVRNVARENQNFSLDMPARDQRIERVFHRPEIMVQTRCDVHPWMRAYIGVVPHPWFAVTDASGAFTIARVPPGEYVLEAWHEVYGQQSQKVTVSENGTVDVQLSFAAE